MSKYLDMIDSDPEQSSEVGKLQSPSLVVNGPDESKPKSNDLDHFEDDRQKYGSTDPRSDKAVDHKYWLELLWNAWHLDKSLNSLYYLLHGIRCGGGELTLTKDSFRLLQGEWSEKEWVEIKQDNLGPIKDRLVKVLRLTRVGKVSDEQLPEGFFNGGRGEAKPVAEVAGTKDVKQEGLF